MLDKNTFGATPAAYFLALRLNEVDNPVTTRKISKCMQHFRNILRDAEEAHKCRAITTTTLCWMLNRLNDQLDDTTIDMLSEERQLDRMAVNMMANVVRGEIKSNLNKSRKIRSLENQQLKLRLTTKDTNTEVRNGNGDLMGWEKVTFVPTTSQLTHIKDPKTVSFLQEKSKKKLKAAGKPNTLY